jgi:hypothetical protein
VAPGWHSLVELEEQYSGCDSLHHADLRAARRRLQHLCARLGHHTASFRLISNSDTIIECGFCQAHCVQSTGALVIFHLDLPIEVVFPDPYRASHFHGGSIHLHRHSA